MNETKTAVAFVIFFSKIYPLGVIRKLNVHKMFKRLGPLLNALCTSIHSHYVLRPGIHNILIICVIGILVIERKIEALEKMEPLLTVKIKLKSVKS